MVDERGVTTHQLPEPSGGDLVLDCFRLRVVEGPDTGRTFTSTDARTVIGTGESADLRLTDSTVSRFHCELVVSEAGVFLRDLGSTNATVVSGVTVREARLDPRAMIRLGRTQVCFEPDAVSMKVRLSGRERFGNMVGRSVASRRAFALLEQAAASDATVLLQGETGTGKEVAAESIHLESARRDGPFVVVDCGSIPSNLLESELFGHARGAFTGADRPREGAFEAANGGTIFLDEIGELDADLQPKLLRVLEKRTVKPVGSNQVVPLDVRVIAATNRDLRVEVNSKAFRADLYFRLAVLQVVLPPLRDRAEDVPLLVSHLVDALGAAGRPEAEVTATPAFRDAVMRHAWPGNVRELRNYVERCLAMQDVALDPSQGLAPVAADGVDVDIHEPLGRARERVTSAFERAYLEKIVAAHDGNVSAAARAAQIDRVHFHRLLRKYGIRGRS